MSSPYQNKRPSLQCKPSRFPCYAWFPTDAYYIYSPTNMDGQMQNFFVQYYYLPMHSS